MADQDDTQSSESEEALVGRLVDTAVARVAGLLTETERTALKEMLTEMAFTHPVLADLLDQLRPRAPREQSGEAAKDGAEVHRGAGDKGKAMGDR
jgi:hypothetical protein